MTTRRRVAVLLAGMRGTGKTSGGERLAHLGEVIDVERLQYKAASAIDPESEHRVRYTWEFWTEHRLSLLPSALSDAFLADHGSATKEGSYVTLVAAILVKDWFLRPLMEVLAAHRPELTWPEENFLVLDYPPPEIHRRTQQRGRSHEKAISLEDVEVEAIGYRESHVKKSALPWRLVPDPQAFELEIARLLDGTAEEGTSAERDGATSAGSQPPSCLSGCGKQSRLT